MATPDITTNITKTKNVGFRYVSRNTHIYWPLRAGYEDARLGKPYDYSWGDETNPVGNAYFVNSFVGDVWYSAGRTLVAALRYKGEKVWSWTASDSYMPEWMAKLDEQNRDRHCNGPAFAKAAATKAAAEEFAKDPRFLLEKAY